jgi:hypothetical protein
MAKPDQFLVKVSRINEAPHENPCETFSAYSVEVTEDGSLSIRGQDVGRFLTQGLWDGFEVKRLGSPPVRNRRKAGADWRGEWPGDWLE